MWLYNVIFVFDPWGLPLGIVQGGERNTRRH